jgi:N-acetyl-anhydromuramyl-L-alanine amidase AmpD
VSAKRSKSSKPRKPKANRRTGIVWGIFLASMTAVCGILVTVQNGPAQTGFLLTTLDTVGPKTNVDPIFQIAQALDRKRWTGIVVHHLGEPAGDAESVQRQHISMGYQGLGYHFLIGNGNGLGDGVIHVGYRWNQQQPGAHVPGKTNLAAQQNQHAIGICLIGNGDRRPFTDRQLAQLQTLIHRLQTELDIPAENVLLHRDLVPQATSPGKLFPAAQFRESLN